MIQQKRIIPVLLLHKGGLYKSVKFGKYKYIGDPINAVRIFNDKEVDELIILDIDASKQKRGPSMSQIADIVSEAFMPIAYGGGVSQMKQAETLIYNGVEKIILNTALFTNPALVTDLAKRYGSQSVIASLDIKKTLLGKHKLFSHSGEKTTTSDYLQFAKKCEEFGVGEIMLNSIDRDGTYQGYEIEPLRAIASSVNIPVIICGGASSSNDFKNAETAGASAMAAGSMFVFQRPNQAVLISYQNSK